MRTLREKASILACDNRQPIAYTRHHEASRLIERFIAAVRLSLFVAVFNIMQIMRHPQGTQQGGASRHGSTKRDGCGFG